MKQEIDQEPGLDRLTAALLWQDRKLLLVFLLLIALPSMLRLALHDINIWVDALWAFLTRACNLLFLYVLSSRWVKALSIRPVDFGPLPALRLLGVGICLWMPAQATYMLSHINTDLLTPALFLHTIALVLSYIYYLYFFTIVLERRSLPAALNLARSFTRADAFSPIKLMLAPFSLVFLLTNIIAIPQPGSNHLGYLLLQVFVAEAFSLLAAYYAIAYIFMKLEAPIWREFELDPYRQDRFKTLLSTTPSWFSFKFHYKYGLLYLGIAACLWLANQARSVSEPPPVDIAVQNITVQDNKVTIRVTLSNAKYKMRGFAPAKLALAGGERAIIAKHPELVHLGGRTENLLFRFPLLDTNENMDLVFSASRSGEDLIKLQDLYLWYAGYKVALLPMNEATLMPKE